MGNEPVTGKGAQDVVAAQPARLAGALQQKGIAPGTGAGQRQQVGLLLQAAQQELVGLSDQE